MKVLVGGAQPLRDESEQGSIVSLSHWLIRSLVAETKLKTVAFCMEMTLSLLVLQATFFSDTVIT